MHPDRRRAGRAIRKQRRLGREAETRALIAWTTLSVEVIEAFTRAIPGLQVAFAAIGEAASNAAEAIRACVSADRDVTPAQHPLWESENPQEERTFPN